MRLLITGAQGFLGRYLAAYWLQTEPGGEVFGIGRSKRLDEVFTHFVHWNGQALPAPLPNSLRLVLASPRYQYEPLELSNRCRLIQLIQDFRPEVIVHLAAALRDDDHESLFRTNVGGCLSLLESIAASEIEMPRVVLGSTGFLYGNLPINELPRREDSLLAPIDLYGISKQAAEAAARLVADKHGIPTLWARIFNPLGPGQDERHFCGWVAMQMAGIAEGLREPVIEVGALDATRDFIDARDTAQALKVLAQHGVPGEIYNVASGIETSVESVFQRLLSLAEIKNSLEIRRLPPRPADVPRHYADISKLLDIGYRPEYSLEQSLRELLDYYRTTVAQAAQ